MERVARGFDTEPIQRGLARIPPRIRERVGHVDFLLGVDPAFVGLHYGSGTDDADGRAYAEVAHFVWPHNQGHRPRSHRVPTVVIPQPQEEGRNVPGFGFVPSLGWITVHELGHELDHLTGFGTWPYAQDGIMPVSEYAATNWWEAFACAFTAWICPELWPDAAGILRDSPVLALFEELAR